MTPPPPKLTEGTEIPLPPITGTETAPVPEPMALTSASWGATVATVTEKIEFKIKSFQSIIVMISNLE